MQNDSTTCLEEVELYIARNKVSTYWGLRTSQEAQHL